MHIEDSEITILFTNAYVLGKLCFYIHYKKQILMTFKLSKSHFLLVYIISEPITNSV